MGENLHVGAQLHVALRGETLADLGVGLAAPGPGDDAGPR